MSNATQHTHGTSTVQYAHTPGLWRAFGNLVRAGSKTVAKVCVLTDGGEEMANAELIARAPDLLAERDALAEQVCELFRRESDLLAERDALQAQVSELRATIELCAVAFEIGAPKQRDAAFVAIRAALAGGGK